MKKLSPQSLGGRESLSRRAVTALLLLLVPVLPLCGGPPQEASQSLRCGGGLTLRLSDENPRQGNLVVLEVQSPEPLEDLRASWATQQLHFWTEGNSENRYYALLGLDLGLPAELGRLSLTARRSSGEPVVCTSLVPVAEGEFAVDRLRVSPGFVQVKPADRARTRREAERLRDIWATVTPERLWDGTFQPPLKKMEPRGNFGRRRFFNNQPRAPHTGEDLRGSRGTPVYAPQRGRVALAENLFYAGNTVILDHGLGLFTYYAHLSKIDVKEGDVIETGKRLGRVGATGRVTGPHLHWAARVGNARVNPLELLALFGE